MARAGFFDPSGRKHFFKLKLRGIPGGEKILSGKTKPPPPPPLGRDSSVTLGMMNDELAWQRAELVEQARKESSALETKEAMLKTAKMHKAALHKKHALQLESTLPWSATPNDAALGPS